MSPRNIAASVRQKLKKATQQGDSFQYTLQRYFLERFLYRLSCSAVASQFVLKGASLFVLWSEQPHRATKDIDLLSIGAPSEGRLRQLFEDVLLTEVEEDGVVFDLESLDVGRIKEGQEYEGVRVTVQARLEQARGRVQIDVGFGDIVTPEPVEMVYPTLLEMPAFLLKVYPRETVIAEKFQAMVSLDWQNSRMKDFYDLWFLATHFSFESELLLKALKATFERRRTPLPEELPVALTEEFENDVNKQTQWKAFLRKNRLGVMEWQTVLRIIRRFVWGLFEGARGRWEVDSSKWVVSEIDGEG
jgi:predicted nucleotidyltransferase component of viral defense system